MQYGGKSAIWRKQYGGKTIKITVHENKMKRLSMKMKREMTVHEQEIK